ASSEFPASHTPAVADYQTTAFAGGSMRLWLIRFGLFLGIAALIGRTEPPLLSAAPAVEAEPGHGEGEATPGPMTATRDDADLALWSLITFLIFLAVLKKYAWGPLIEGLDKRETSVLDNIAAAEAARVKAEKMLAEHAAKLEKVQDEVREIIAEARRDAEH